MVPKRRVNYIEAAMQVLKEFGGGPISTKTLVNVALERGLIEPRKYVYHNFSRKVRESELFDTSVRGQIRLASTDEVEIEVKVGRPEAVFAEPEAVFPGPTLGDGVRD